MLLLSPVLSSSSLSRACLKTCWSVAQQDPDYLAKYAEVYAPVIAGLEAAYDCDYASGGCDDYDIDDMGVT
jgi:hypothetical protein